MLDLNGRERGCCTLQTAHRLINLAIIFDTDSSHLSVTCRYDGIGASLSQSIRASLREAQWVGGVNFDKLLRAHPITLQFGFGSV